MTDGKGQILEKRRRRSLLLAPYSLLPTRLDPGLLLAGLLALFVIHPLLQPGLPGSADTPIHFYRTLEFARSWAPGVVYPRWAPDLAYGYGYPLWDFAPPLPYFIPLALRAAGLSLEASLKGLIILTALGYGLGAYLFVRDSLGPKAGLVGAAIYTLAPFALREALLYGGNYPQYLAIGLYPWVLWSLGRVKRRGGWLNIVLVAIFYGGVILSHLFHALILTPVAATYALALWLSDRRGVRRLGTSALALGLGLLGTAFFWLPALVERTFTHSTEDVYLRVSPFYLRFLSWRELLAWPQALDARSADPWVPFSLGLAALLLGALGLLVLLLGAGGCPSRLPGPLARTGRHAGREGLGAG
ncbi:MAG: 6-pyruvoyl-tetrahydropterin synthase-related protein, partial [Anaerolineae bacterium]